MAAARTVLRRNAMVEFNPIPALAWHALGIRLWSAPRALRSEVQTFVRGHANAAHARPNTAGGGNRLRKAA